MAAAIRELAKVHDAQLGAIAKALGSIAVQLKYLGNGDAGTPMGAIEHLAVQIKDGATTLADALRRVDAGK